MGVPQESEHPFSAKMRKKSQPLMLYEWIIKWTVFLEKVKPVGRVGNEN